MQQKSLSYLLSLFSLSLSLAVSSKRFEIVIEFMGLKEAFEISSTTTAADLLDQARKRFSLEVRTLCAAAMRVSPALEQSTKKKRIEKSFELKASIAESEEGA